jgi:hypothetical protein
MYDFCLPELVSPKERAHSCQSTTSSVACSFITVHCISVVKPESELELFAELECNTVPDLDRVPEPDFVPESDPDPDPT